MSHGYGAIGWTRDKRNYDLALAALLGAYLATFIGASAALNPDATAESLIIRGTGSAAFAALHAVLSIGPLARLDPRFLPVLYNRRHLGVTLFLVALAHAAFVVFQFHALGNANPLTSVIASRGARAFPFEWFGILAFVVLLLMAVTSHDFWLAVLGPRVWKTLHLGVYLAWFALVLHVVRGILYAETSWVYVAVIGAAGLGVIALHLLAALRSREPAEGSRAEGGGPETDNEGFVACGPVDTIPEKRARMVTLSGERVAIFRYDGRVSAVSNVCRHQHGPLGEGRIVDGCITCPWHGYQYRPESGQSPPPYTEKVPSFDVRVREGIVFVHPRPHPPGTPVQPAECAPPAAASAGDDFYIGWAGASPARLRFLGKVAASLVAVAIVLGPLLASQQRTFGPGVFEFGQVRTVEGTLRLRPVPVLEVPAPGGGARRWLLVGMGKHGVPASIASLDGRRVRLGGTLAFRDDQTLVELGDAPPADLGPGSAEVPASSEGNVTLSGEIVDSKCFVGVMNPANLESHRGCAIRCISGGIPPMLLVRGEDGRALHVLLVGPGGEAIGPRLLDRVAVPVSVQGTLESHGELRVLRTDPATIRRL